MATTIAAIAALWFTSQSLRATNNQYFLSEQTALTDRFRLAAEQLGSDKVDVRLSGIYLFERLAKDSPADHSTVFAVISAFLRSHATIFACEPTTSTARWTKIPEDIQAAVSVIGRRDTGRDTGPVDLHNTCLTGADLTGANFSHANLVNASLTGINLTNANFTGADLTNANFNIAGPVVPVRSTDATFTDANLTNANFTNANLSETKFTNANLINAKLPHTNLSGTNLRGAHLSFADISGADLSGADLGGASLLSTNLDGAYLSDASLSGVTYDSNTRWPPGFTPP